MNSYSKTFGYNIFSGNSVLFFITILPIMAGAILAVLLSYLWMALTMAYYLLLLCAGYWIRNHRKSLIIDQSGITLTKLSGDIEFVSWSDVGGFHSVTKGSGKSQKHGIGIVDANSNSNVSLSEDYDNGPYIMFIETCHGIIADRKDVIIKAVENGIDCYVHHKGIITHDFTDDIESQNLWKTGISILLVLFALMCVYFIYQYENIHSTLYEELIEHSLINGRNYSNSFISKFGYYLFPITGVIMVFYFPTSLICYQFKRAVCFLAATLILLLTGYFLIIPEQKRFSDNCHDLVFHHADTVTTVVNNLHSGKGGDYTSFDIEYGSIDYRVRTYHAKGATKGMPMRIVVQKGSSNIPVITMVEITDNDYHWKRNILGDTYNEQAYQYAKDGDLNSALKTIDKAIATDSTIANYYDSKGEFLLRNGDKDGAALMWMKVITIDPHFVDNNNSWLQKQLINLGILAPSRLNGTLVIVTDKIRNNPKKSTMHWDTSNIVTKWTEEQITINGKKLGHWIIIESSSVDPIIHTDNREEMKAAPKYGMMLAYQTRPARVLILIGERSKDNLGVYTSVNPPMDNEVKVWFGQREMFFHPKPCSDIHGVYELNESESRQFITNANKKEEITFVSVRKGSRVIAVHTFGT